MEDWLKKWYKDQFSKIDSSPAPKVWDNLSVSMKEWPNHWYNSNTNELKTAPRPSTWSALNSQLADISYPARSMRPSFVLIAIMIFSLSLIPISLSDGDVNTKNTENLYLVNYKTPDFTAKDHVLNKGNDTSVELSKNERTILSLAENFEKNNRFENHESLTDAILKEVTSSVPTISKSLVKKETTGKLTTIDSLTKNNFNILSLKQRIINYPETILSNYRAYLPKDIFNPKYSIGLHLVPQFSSLTNPMRTKVKGNVGVEKSNPVSVGFDLSFDKYFSSKNSLRINVRGNNVKSLKFREHNTLKEMTLNYASLNVSYGRKWPLDSSDKLLLKTYIGVYTGYAVSKDVNYDGKRVDYIEDGLRNIDIGNSIDLILSRKLSEKMSLEIGASTQFGVINIFKGTDVLPSKYFKTSTISYGLSVGLIREF